MRILFILDHQSSCFYVTGMSSSLSHTKNTQHDRILTVDNTNVEDNLYLLVSG